jgi:hypothetical protein
MQIAKETLELHLEDFGLLTVPFEITYMRLVAHKYQHAYTSIRMYAWEDETYVLIVACMYIDI